MTLSKLSKEERLVKRLHEENGPIKKITFWMLAITIIIFCVIVYVIYTPAYILHDFIKKRMVK